MTVESYRNHPNLGYIGTIWLDTGQVFEFYRLLNWLPENKLVVIRTDNEEFEAYYANNRVFFGHDKYDFYRELINVGVLTPTYDMNYNAIKIEFSEDYKQSQLY